MENPHHVNVFTFENHEIVRTQLVNQHLYFVAKDVCKCLNVTWNGNDTLKNIPESWKGVWKLHTPYGGSQRVIMINEAALYKLAFRSNKPEADLFTNWVVSEVLPAIRKNGAYSIKEKKQKPEVVTKEVIKYVPAALSDYEASMLRSVKKIVQEYKPRNLASLIEDLLLAYKDLLKLGNGQFDAEKYREMITAARVTMLFYVGLEFDKQHQLI